MVGAGETYFAAFALALGIDKVTAGLVATVPMLLGAALQLVSPWAVRRLRSNGRWCILTAALQAAAFVPLIVAALAGSVPTVLLFAIVAVYWGAGFAAGPSWTTWIETLVPRRISSHYFARRSAWCYVALLAALVAAGAALQFGDERGAQLAAFAGLFLLAGAGRAVSARFLAAQSEPVPQPPGERHVPMAELLSRWRKGEDGRFIVFLLAAQLAIQISQPFVTSWLRGELHLSYGAFAALLAVPYVARIAVLPFLGGVAHRLGSRRLMWIGALLLVPAAGLWVVSANVFWIAFVQVVTGVALAAFELANLLLWFEKIRHDERTSILTTYQFWYGAAVVTGSVIGSVILVLLGEGHTAFVAVFAVAAAARLGAAALFLRR
jgi:MFS family permease